MASKKKVTSWTVLVLRPDYIADEFGKDTFLTIHVVKLQKWPLCAPRLQPQKLTALIRKNSSITTA